MKKIERPQLSVLHAVNACLQGCTDFEYTNRVSAIVDSLVNAEKQYDKYATKGRLDLIEKKMCDNVSKDDMVRLYTDGMVRRKEGRRIYDVLRSGSTNCAYCEVAIVETLDHVLEKAIYPLYSVCPLNLVPSCLSCNKNKNEYKGDRILWHPYYDHKVDYRWLYAEYQKGGEVGTIRFYVDIPIEHKDDYTAHRLKESFVAFHLAEKYAVSCETMLMSMKTAFYCAEKTDINALMESGYEESLHCFGVNHMMVAMYDALRNNDDYLSDTSRGYV